MTTPQSQKRNVSTQLKERWRQIQAYFLRLHWKLTLAYTLSTVITILILGGAGIGLLWYLNFRSNFVPNLLGEGLTKTTYHLEPYFEPTPPDRAGLNAWLDEVITAGNMVVYIPRERAAESGDESDLIPGQFGRVSMVGLVDAEGRTLTTYPETLAPAGSDFRDHLSPVMRGGFEAALRGETEPSHISIRDEAGYLVATAPIFDEAEQVVGAIFVRSSLPIEAGEYLQNAFQRLVLPVAGGMLVVGLIAGIFFGFFISRNLTRRLKMLDTAAAAWSQGNFDVLAPDTSEDELGHLARHFNHMAIQLQNLLQTRHGLATLEERNRLARDLHDSVKQQVFATAMQVGAAKALIDQNPAAAKEHILEAEQLVRQAQQELTGLIKELRPAALAGQGLAGALQDYAADWSRRSHIPAEVRVRGERPLPLPVEQTFFRVAQEALTNIARHSQATATEIDLIWENKGLRLTIRDNGRGFEAARSNGKGVGLHSMRERMAALGGCLAVESRPGGGTQVVAEVANIE